MQFTVLIEFLVPGLATTLLALALLPSGAVPELPKSVPAGETVSALLLLAVSYPIGILTNFPIFVCFQQWLLTPMARRRIVEKYAQNGVDLIDLGRHQFGSILGKKSISPGRREIREFFNLMSARVFRCNIDRLNANHLYHEGIQRFARGMLLPLLLAIAFVGRSQKDAWLALIMLLGSFIILSLALLVHSINTEEEQIVRFFISSPTELAREAIQNSAPNAQDVGPIHESKRRKGPANSTARAGG